MTGAAEQEALRMRGVVRVVSSLFEAITDAGGSLEHAARLAEELAGTNLLDTAARNDIVFRYEKRRGA